MKKLTTLFLLCLTAQAFALEVAGVKLADSVRFGSRDLQLNGVGVRSKLFFDLYIAALYLPGKITSGAAVLADGGEKRMALHLLVDIGAERLLSGLNNAIAANHTPAEMSALDAPFKEFSAIFHAIGEMKKGDVITLDYLPGSGTQVGLNGAVKGTVGGAPFNSALLKAWLGDKPAQVDLKQKLLGGP
ncbi:MAG: chalcone isomerase family protein [Nitrosomonadales bacterium]|nr:chalcone isomerase family protein [Nitrosomonadales bacterium]